MSGNITFLGNQLFAKNGCISQMTMTQRSHDVQQTILRDVHVQEQVIKILICRVLSLLLRRSFSTLHMLYFSLRRFNDLQDSRKNCESGFLHVQKDWIGLWNRQIFLLLRHLFQFISNNDLNGSKTTVVGSKRVVSGLDQARNELETIGTIIHLFFRQCQILWRLSLL